VQSLRLVLVLSLVGGGGEAVGQRDVTFGAVKVLPGSGLGPQAPFDSTVAAIDAAAKSAQLFEGLPHPFERELLESEQKRAATRRLHGELFYEKAQAVPSDAAEKLRVAMNDAVRPYRGMKLCGGFHADYAITWQTGRATYAALVCFGCSEIKLHVPGGELTADMSAEGAKALRLLLEPFRKERPPRQPVKTSG
jgi:hypothetical protein